MSDNIDILQVLAQENGFENFQTMQGHLTGNKTSQKENEYISKLFSTNWNPSAQNNNEKKKTGFFSTIKKSFSLSKYDDFSGGNQLNSGIPTLQYLFLGGSLYNPYLNITTVAHLYSVVQQVAPVFDCVQTICSPFRRLQIELKQKKNVKQTEKGEETRIENINLDAYKKRNNSIEQINRLLRKPHPITTRNFTDLKNAFAYEMQSTGNAFITIEYGSTVKIEDIKNCKFCEIKNWEVVKTIDITQFDTKFIGKKQIPAWRESRFGVGKNALVEYDEVFIDNNGNLRQCGEYTKILSNNTTVKVWCEIIHRSLGTSNTYVGLSRIFTCMNWAETYYLASLFVNNYFKNSGSPAGILSVKPYNASNPGVISEDQKAELQNMMRNQIKGATNSGRIIMNSNTSYEYVFTPISSTVKEADLKNIIDMASEEIRNIFNYPNVLKARVGQKYSVSSEEERFYKESIFPLNDIFVDLLNDIFINTNSELLNENYFFAWDKQTFEAFERIMIENSIALYNAGALTTNEFREKLDLPPLEDDIGNQTILTLKASSNKNVDIENEISEI